jgi:murein DD-endopeptidase MepM/ murein hydrolase activator NlpD
MSDSNLNKGQSVFRTKVRDIFSRKFTFLIIPHGPGNPKQVNIHLSHIVLFLLLWTAVTGWGSYLSAQHVDYWRTKLNNQVLTRKVNYLVAQLDKNTGFLDQVKDIEGQLREMLQYKDEANLIEHADNTRKAATGGPTLGDQNELSSLLNHSEEDISWNRLIEKTGVMKLAAQSRIHDYQDITKYVDTKRRMFRATPRGWPAQGPISSAYGNRNNPFNRDGDDEEFHPGIDISGLSGTPVRATADGKVLLAGWHSGYGNLVVLQHEFGFTTRYGHNSKILVKYGQTVKRGQVVALMGQTGRASGPHCHYEVWRFEARQNPIGYVHELFPKFKSAAKSVVSKKVKPAAVSS